MRCCGTGALTPGGELAGYAHETRGDGEGYSENENCFQ